MSNNLSLEHQLAALEKLVSETPVTPADRVTWNTSRARAGFKKSRVLRICEDGVVEQPSQCGPLWVFKMNPSIYFDRDGDVGSVAFSPLLGTSTYHSWT